VVGNGEGHLHRLPPPTKNNLGAWGRRSTKSTAPRPANVVNIHFCLGEKHNEAVRLIDIFSLDVENFRAEHAAEARTGEGTLHCLARTAEDALGERLVRAD
jgi:hypothetical protein